MKKLIWLVALLLTFGPVASVAAETALPALVFREVKIKGQDFIVLQATVDAVKLDEYWLGYSSSQALESIDPDDKLATVSLDKDESVLLVNDDAVPACDSKYTMSMPIDLADSKGTLVLWHRTVGLTPGSIVYDRVDSFTWTATASAKADIVRPDSVEKSLALPVWFRDLKTGTMTWKVGDLTTNDAGCTLTVVGGTTSESYVDPETKPPEVKTSPTTKDDTSSKPTPETGDKPATEAETKDTASSESGSTTTKPVSEASSSLGAVITPPTTQPEGSVLGETVVLDPPKITELLPNPTGSGTDDTDEYIELFNPNDIDFPIGGYTLQTGTTTKHSYVFPVGTTLAAKSFTAFYSSATKLTLSNTAGQARLIDPKDNVLSETAAYDGADDGMAWALVNDVWQWTTTPTPSAVNLATSPVLATASAVSAVKLATATVTNKLATTTTKAAATTKVATTAAKSSTTAKTTKTTKTAATTTKKAATSTKGVASVATQPVRGIHPLVLAGVVMAAVGYGLYEHRNDMANALYKFRSNRAVRRSNRG